jgi:hypothetical protein
MPNFLGERDGSGNVLVTPAPLDNNPKYVIGCHVIDRMGPNDTAQLRLPMATE